MNILFYNLYNIGDTYFSQPFVSNIVKNNPTCTFFYFVNLIIIFLKILIN